MRITGIDTTLEITTTYFDGVLELAQSDKPTSMVKEAFYAVGGEFDISERAMNDNPELKKRVLETMRAVRGLQQDIVSTLRPVLKQIESAALAADRALQKEARE